MKKNKVVFALLLLFINSLFLPGILAQDQKSEQDKVLKLKSELISVRAVVTDKSGKVIDGLKKEDFELLESNQLQEISFFSRENIGGDGKLQINVNTSTHDRVGQTPPSSPATVKRTIVLFVDTLHISQENLPKLKDTLKQFIATKLTSEDTIALVTTNAQLGVLEQFTQDKQIVYKGLDKLRAQFIETSKNLFTPYLAAEVLKRDPDALTVGRIILDSQSGGRSTSGRGKSGTAQMQQAEINNEARRVLLQESSLRQASLSVLKAIAERLTNMPGQRILTVFSEGFTLLSDTAGRDLADVKAVTGRAARAGVVIYSFDTKGLAVNDQIDASHQLIVPTPRDSRSPDITAYWSALRASTARELEDGVSILAAETGGKAIFNTNDFSPALSKVIDDNRLYYTLDYYSSNNTEDKKFRPILVRIKAHPEYLVRAQKGYLPLLATKDEEKDSTPVRQVIRAMHSPFPVTDIQVTASPNFFELDGDDAQLSLSIFIDANSIKYLEKDQQYLFDVDMAVAFHDKSGKVVKSFTDKMQGGLTAEQLATAKRTGYRYGKRIVLEPGIFNIRIGLYDNNSGKIGTAIAWAEVPNLKKGALTLSNLVLAAEDNSSTNKAGASSHSTWQNGLRIYKNGESLSYLAKVYNISDEANLLTQSQIYQGETLVYQSNWQPASARMAGKDKKGIELSQELQLGKAKPGTYELKVIVKDKKSNQIVEANSLFKVEP
jgi:VWFA-related protein